MPGRSRWRRSISAAVGILALACLGTLWWLTPRSLTIDVQVPEGTRSEYLDVAVLKERAPGGPLREHAARELHFADQRARSTSFTVRVPRGDYRVAVVCDHTELVMQPVRVLLSQTVVIKLRPSAESPHMRFD